MSAASSFPTQGVFTVPYPPYPPGGDQVYMSGGLQSPAFDVNNVSYGTTDPPNEDETCTTDDCGAFADKAVRRGFVRKVYGILMCQLLITLGGICIFMYHQPTRDFIAKHSWIHIVATVLLFAVMIPLVCLKDIRREFPCNLILLTLFTVVESFMLGTIAAHYDTQEVVMAVGITAAVCLGITLFALQTKWDFTNKGGYLFVFLLVLLIFGIAVAIFRTKILSLVYASLGVLLFSFYLVFDTQLLLTGKHDYTISPEEYIFAALNIYLDIIQLLIFILRIIGLTRK